MSLLDQLKSSTLNIPNIQRFNGLAKEAIQEYPVLGDVPFVVIEGEGEGYAEVYPSWEEFNPVPGKNVIEIRQKGRDLPDDEMKSMIAGEVLHFLGGLDENRKPVNAGFRKFKDEFMKSLTAEQSQFERRFHRNLVNGGKERRSFEDFMEISRADAYIRGYLFPDKNAEFLQDGVFTPQQKTLLEQARSFLQKKQEVNR